MIIFNYVFYRVYTALAKKDDLPYLKGAALVTLCITGLLFYLYMDIVIVLTGEHNSRYLIFLFAAVYMLLLYYYKKRKKMVLKQFNNSKLDKHIPYYIIIFSFVPCMIIGVNLGYLFEFVLSKYHFGPIR